MKNLLSVFFLFISLSAFSQSDIQKVTGLMQEQEASWNRGDIPAFMQHYWHSDSLMFIGSKGVTYSWQKTLDNYLKSYPDKATMGTLKFTIIKSEQLSDKCMYIIGKWELAREKPVGGHFTLLWKKINERWVIVADHTS